MAIVLVVVSVLVITVVNIGSSVRNKAKLSNAINQTANVDFINKDSLVFWLESSVLSNTYKNDDVILNLVDNSKNSINFISNNENYPKFKKSSLFSGLYSIYFDGSSYLKSNKFLNLSEYTAFIVCDVVDYSAGDIYSSGIVAKSSEVRDNKFVVIKNNGENKYIKFNGGNFTNISNIDDFVNSPQQMTIGHFNGNIYEIIIFNRVLNDKDINNIESYLNNKYKR